MQLALGGGIAGNMLQVWLTNQGLNSIAIGATIGKNILPDWEIPGTGFIPWTEGTWTIHGVMDWCTEKFRSFVPMVANAAADAIDTIADSMGEGDGGFELPTLPF